MKSSTKSVAKSVRDVSYYRQRYKIVFFQIDRVDQR